MVPCLNRDFLPFCFQVNSHLVNLRDGDFRIPLHYAAKQGSRGITKLLLLAKSEVSAHV
jgi:hypothetical protein